MESESYVAGAGGALRLGCRPAQVCLPTKSFGLPWKTSEGKYLRSTWHRHRGGLPAHSLTKEPRGNPGPSQPDRLTALKF
jgi:hypothetical protein